jgi:uncharacterized membrane protein YphA (DoxX/SURF4 family)
MLLVTVSTIDWLTFSWLKRNFAFFSTVSTNCFVHLTWAEIASKSTGTISAAAAESHVFYLVGLVIPFIYWKRIVSHHTE